MQTLICLLHTVEQMLHFFKSLVPFVPCVAASSADMPCVVSIQDPTFPTFLAQIDICMQPACYALDAYALT